MSEHQPFAAIWESVAHMESMDEQLRQSVRPLTKDEIRAQRISFVMGMMPDGSKMSREEVEEFINERYG